MSWVDALDKLLKLKGIHDKVKEVRKIYDMQLAAVEARLAGRNADIDGKIEVVGHLAEYCKGLEDAFMKIAQIPSLGDTAQNAMFFSLGQDASQLKGRAYTLKGRLAKVKEKNAKLIAEADTKIAENRLWMEWAKSGSPAKEGNLKANERAKKPKK